ncbi:hypothetical protein K501DRAFT_214697 [Backusella circina FSU 941]|nr:hypothetical protein K501DRAFT_214697 [Backusella circina FSU 941]
MSSPPPKHSLSLPTSGSIPHPVLPTPSSSTTVSSMRPNPRQELERQLAEKQRQLQESHSGIGKNVLARQVSQLQDKLRDLDNKVNDDEAHSDRLRTLERDYSAFRSHPLSPSIRNKDKMRSSGLEPLPSPTTSTLLPPSQDSTSLLPLPPPPTGSTPTKRRSRIPNADRRNTDIEFATEIGQGLLLEVRKMQAMVHEKEEQLRILEAQKADLERAAEAMAKQMRQREENEEKLKEETWNLELAKQELTITVTELQQNLSKANVEQTRLSRQVSDLRSEIEHLRDKEEKLNAAIEKMKTRHEQDMSTIRRQAALIQREKADQSKQIETLTSELAIAKAQSRIGKHVLPEKKESNVGSELPDDTTQTVLAVKSEDSPSTSPPSSPKQLPTTRNQAMEVDTLKTSLSHAHRTVLNLRSSLLKEKSEKVELKKLLAESQEAIEGLQNDHKMWVDAPTSISSTKDQKKSSKAANQKKRPVRKPRSKTSEDLDDTRKRKDTQTTQDDDNDSVYSYSAVVEAGSDIEEIEEDDTRRKYRPLSSELSQSQRPIPIMVDAQVNTDPISIDESLQSSAPQRSLGDELGMVLSHTPDDQSSSKGALVGAAAAGTLAAELMQDASKHHAGVEISTQTDVLSEKNSAEMSTQTEPEPLSETAEMSIQTEPIPEIECKEMSIQTEYATSEISTQTQTPLFEQINLGSESSEPSTIAYETSTQPSYECEPEDPKVAEEATAAAIAAAIASARALALEKATSTATQSNSIQQCDQETQSDNILTHDKDIQYESSGLDQYTQSDNVDMVDSAVQSDELFTTDLNVPVQSEGKADSNEAIVVPMLDKESSVDHENAIGENQITQSSSVQKVDTGVQSSDLITADAAVQYEPEFTTAPNSSRSIPGVIPLPISSKSYTSDDESDAFFDANSALQSGLQSKPTSKGAESVGTVYYPARSGLTMYNRETPPVSRLDIITPPPLFEKPEVESPGGMDDDDKDIFDDNLSEKSSPADSVETMRDSHPKSNDDKLYSKEEADALIAAAVAAALANARSSINVHELNNVDHHHPEMTKENAEVNKEVDSKNHSSADILAAAAAGAAAATILHNNNGDSKSSPNTKIEEEQSINNNGVAVSPAATKPEQVDTQVSNGVNANTQTLETAIAVNNKSMNGATPDINDVDQEHGEEIQSRALENIPHESTLDNKATEQNEKDSNDVALLPNLSKEKKTKQKVELSAGPSIVFNQDPYEPELTEADVPARPSNPPPTNLLNRAGLPPHARDFRSLSPVSVRSNSKGKAPMEYSDMESSSIPSISVSNEDLYHQQRLQQNDLNKRESVSSMSTNNTNEQLHSIHSSRSTTDTSANMIGMITQTMIGDWLWKYTHKKLGGGMSETRHKRFFWIHPYTRTLYWSNGAPGVNGHSGKAKSALIENIQTVPEYSTGQSGLPNVSLLIQTNNRQLKLTAPTLEKHELWLEAISHLISRNKIEGLNNNGSSKPNPDTSVNRSLSSSTSHSILKRASFQRLHDLFHQPSQSVNTDLVDLDHADDEDEALEDVRMCCNGKHHVSKLEKGHLHRHQYRRRKTQTPLVA